MRADSTAGPKGVTVRSRTVSQGQRFGGREHSTKIFVYKSTFKQYFHHSIQILPLPMRYYDTDSFVETPRDPRGLRCASLRNEPNGWHPTVSVVGPLRAETTF